MKKVNKNSRISDLIIDVIEYAFIEWLIRQNVYSAFKANYKSANSFRGSFRDQLRFHIQIMLSSPDLGSRYLVSTAFPFTRTPEGFNFWDSKSEAWRRFCANFQM